MEESLYVRKKKLLADRHTAQGGGGVKRGSKEPSVNTNGRCQGVETQAFGTGLCVPMLFSLERASVWVSFPVNGESFVLVDY